MRIQSGPIDGVPFHLCQTCGEKLGRRLGPSSKFSFWRCDKCDKDICTSCKKNNPINTEKLPPGRIKRIMTTKGPAELVLKAGTSTGLTNDEKR
jgi:ribosomal protein L37AE/L43A